MAMSDNDLRREIGPGEAALNARKTAVPKAKIILEGGPEPLGVEAPEHSRPDWHTYFLAGTVWVAMRADCRRRQVGCVIVSKDNRIIATGYNGAEPGGKSCLAGECPRGLMSKEKVAPGSSYDTGAGVCIALHAEQNALLYCSREDRIGATIYVSDEPCDGCMRMIKGSGVYRVMWPDGEKWVG